MYEYSVCTSKAADDALFTDRAPLAMAFVRDQSWEAPMRAHDALNHGTAFPGLAKPFTGAEVCDEE